jgi:hypothetical protein
LSVITGTLDLETDELQGATLSPCRTYRYRLWRYWGSGPRLNVLMLNPSTADEQQDDPTIRKCLHWARKWGCGGLVVTNLFALRSADPRNLKKVADPVGPENDRHILEVARGCGSVLCAWGNDGALLNRAERVYRLLRKDHCLLYALKVSKTGEPCHPLYLPYALAAQDYERGLPAPPPGDDGGGIDERN